MTPFGPYVPVRRLGAGAFGEVWEVRHQESGASYALKVLAQVHDPEDRLRFGREAEALGRLDHPNVVRVHAAVLEGERPYIVQEFVTGGDLAQRVRQGPLAWEDAVRIAAEVAEGLAAAHAAGILHRDLKPENVLLDATGRPRLVDFGLARLSDASRLTETNTVMGTPVYMSPEQACGEQLDERSEVYALGALLFALLTGRAPFVNQGSLLGVLAAVTEDPPPRARELRAELPAWLDELCARTLSKDPQERPATATEFTRCLREQGLPGGPRGRGPWSWGVALVLLVACAASVSLIDSTLRSESPTPSSPKPQISAGAPAPEGSPVDQARARWPKAKRLPHSKRRTAASFHGEEILALDQLGLVSKWSMVDRTWERQDLFNLNLTLKNKSQRPVGLIPWRDGWIAAVRFEPFAFWRPGAKPRFFPSTSTCIARAGDRVFLNFEVTRYQLHELLAGPELKFESRADIEPEALPDLDATRNQIDGIATLREGPPELLLWTDKRLFLWGEEGGLRPLPDRSGEDKRGRNQTVAVAPGRRRFVVASNGTQAFLVDIEGEAPWRWLPVPLESVSSGLSALVFAGADSLYAVAKRLGGGTEILAWDLSGDQPRLTHHLATTSERSLPSSIDYHPAGFLAIGLSDGRIWLLNLDRLPAFRGEVRVGGASRRR